MDAKRAAYCAKYTVKKLTRPHDERLSEGMEPEFRTAARVPPLGTAFLDSLVRRYRHGPGAKIVADRGDVERSFRLNGKIYPLDEYSLRYLRKRLDIPLLHGERAAAHPNYLDWHETQEAECDPTTNQVMETRYHAKEKALRARRSSL